MRSPGNNMVDGNAVGGVIAMIAESSTSRTDSARDGACMITVQPIHYEDRAEKGYQAKDDKA
jgi:hypothetical protein